MRIKKFGLIVGCILSMVCMVFIAMPNAGIIDIVRAFAKAVCLLALIGFCVYCLEKLAYLYNSGDVK